MIVPIGNNKVMVDMGDITPEWIGEMCSLGLMTDDVIDDLDKLLIGRWALKSYENKVWKERGRKSRGNTLSIDTFDKKKNEKLEVVQQMDYDKIPGKTDREVEKMSKEGEDALNNLIKLEND